MKLTAKQRKDLPVSAFALPKRRYPIPDASHARNALARVARHGTPAEKSKVRAEVKADYPAIKQGSKAHAKPKAKGRGY